MQENQIRMPLSETSKMPRVFRQNVLFICVFTVIFQSLYFPFFFIRRRHALQQICTLPRYLFHIILMIVGVVLPIVGTGSFSFYTALKTGTLNQERTLSQILSMMEEYDATFRMLHHLGYIIALLCFIFVLVDLLVLLSDVLRRLKLRFPKFLQYTPYIFIGVAFFHVVIAVLAIQYRLDDIALSWFVITQMLLGVALVMTHMYITNIYVLIRAFQVKKES